MELEGVFHLHLFTFQTPIFFIKLIYKKIEKSFCYITILIHKNL